MMRARDAEAEDRALDIARSIFEAAWRSDDWEESRATLSDMLEASGYGNDLAGIMAAAKSGGAPLRHACLKFIDDLAEAGASLPSPFGAFRLTRLNQVVPKGRPANRERDNVIGFAVETVVDECLLAATRNESRKTADDGPSSACSIVARALGEFGVHLSEAAIEKIWKKYNRARA